MTDACSSGDAHVYQLRSLCVLASCDHAAPMVDGPGVAARVGAITLGAAHLLLLTISISRHDLLRCRRPKTARDDQFRLSHPMHATHFQSCCCRACELPIPRTKHPRRRMSRAVPSLHTLLTIYSHRSEHAPEERFLPIKVVITTPRHHLFTPQLAN